MDQKAENVVQNVGAIAETTSIFYNSISGRVPKDVALVLTQHFMDLTIARRPAGPNLAAIVAAVQAAEAQRKALEQKKKDQAAGAKPQAEPESPPAEPPEAERL